MITGILAAIAWPSALLSAANIIDNPWSVALQRAQTAGKMLAEVLLAREQVRRILMMKDCLYTSYRYLNMHVRVIND